MDAIEPATYDDVTEGNARSLNAQREKTLALQDDFNSDETPDPDAFVQTAARRMRTKKDDLKLASHNPELEHVECIAHARDVTKAPRDLTTYDAVFEYGDSIEHARDAIGSDDVSDRRAYWAKRM